MKSKEIIKKNLQFLKEAGVHTEIEYLHLLLSAMAIECTTYITLPNDKNLHAKNITDQIKIMKAICRSLDGNKKIEWCSIKDIDDLSRAMRRSKRKAICQHFSDPSISETDMNQYGYAWKGMIPLRENKAKSLFKEIQLYKLYGDNTESVVESIEEIAEHTSDGGIFGIEISDVNAYYKRECKSMLGRDVNKTNYER